MLKDGHLSAELPLIENEIYSREDSADFGFKSHRADQKIGEQFKSQEENAAEPNRRDAKSPPAKPYSLVDQKCLTYIQKTLGLNPSRATKHNVANYLFNVTVSRPSRWLT